MVDYAQQLPKECGNYLTETSKPREGLRHRSSSVVSNSLEAL